MHSLWTSCLRLPLWGVWLLSLMGYILIGQWFPFAPYVETLPLQDINHFANTVGAVFSYIVWFCALFCLYVLAYRKVSQTEYNHLAYSSLFLLLVSTCLLALPLLTTYPFNATDLYRYVVRGRVYAVHGENPFEMPPDSFPDDPYLSFAGEWADATSPYGPLWELISAGIVNQNLSFYGSLLAIKGVMVGAHLLITLFIWLILVNHPPPIRLGRTLLWAWNPTLLLVFVADGHNDVLMLLWLVIAWWLLQKRYAVWGMIVAVFGILTKPIALLVFPFLALTAWQKMPTIQTKVRLVLLTIAGSSLVVYFAFLPFGSPWALITRLVMEANDIAGFSVPTLFMLIGQWADIPNSVTGIKQITPPIFMVYAILLFIWAWIRHQPIRRMADTLWGYILTAISFRIWYAVWMAPWLLVDTQNDHRFYYRLHAGIWLLFTSQLSVFIYGHLWRALLGRDHFWSHLIGIPFTFGLPFLLALYSTRYKANKKPVLVHRV